MKKPKLTIDAVDSLEREIKAAIPDILTERLDYGFSLIACLPNRPDTITRVANVHRFKNDPPTFIREVGEVVAEFRAFHGAGA